MACKLEWRQSSSWSAYLSRYEPRGKGKLPESNKSGEADLYKLVLLRALVLWSLNSSDIIKETLAVAYKQNRKEDDMNQPLAVQPWGTDGRKRKYWLIEGQNDTSFRIYKQSRPKEADETWYSVAGSLDELRAVADDLRINDGTQLANRLADRMELAIPRLEASEEVSRFLHLGKSELTTNTRNENEKSIGKVVKPPSSGPILAFPSTKVARVASA